MKKLAYSISSVGTRGSFGMEIYIDVNRELNDNDYWNISHKADEIRKSIMEESIKLDPESKKEAEKEKTDIVNLFGDRTIFVEETPNGYCSDYCCKHLPWFIVTTNKGRIKIGWRKRVIEINWLGSIIEQSAQSLFPDEDVTKFDQTIHAWGLDKAKEYIDKLLS